MKINNEYCVKLINKLSQTQKLSAEEFEVLVKGFSLETAAYAAELALKKRREIYGSKVYIRGLIEISNICKNDCYYCGIRASNKKAARYRLSEEEILRCCRNGYALGFRTFVMQGGEDPYFTDEKLVNIIGDIKSEFPDCAVTLSLGERSLESYQRLYSAGADRYLLRHETADFRHYARLHPENLSFSNRMQCLNNLKKVGFQVGCGFMVGSPFQTTAALAMDLKFICDFKPDMCGVGPFIPHRDTPFKDFPGGSVELTCYLLSLIRLIHPQVLLPATTALGSIASNGREKGILAGANVLMPNLSPSDVRAKYELYNNKLSIGAEAAEGLAALKESLFKLGYEITVDRGDVKHAADK